MNKKLEPYRLLFPVGLMFALSGTTLWIAYGFGRTSTYPGLVHARVMIGAFLLAFVCGFLMTAVPKMTASFPARFLEILLAAGLTLITGISAHVSDQTTFYTMAAITLLFLVTFGARRIYARTKQIPPFFAFVGVGLMCGLFGSILLLLVSTGLIPDAMDLGRRLFFQGMILSLVLGIGSRLVPVITKNEISNQRTSLNFALAALIPTALAVEASGWLVLGGILKASVATFVALSIWKFHRRLKSKSKLGLGMKISAAMILVGLWLSVLYPAFAVHWMHFTYIGGFGLMTLTVASRVTLAHGHYDLSFEADSKSLLIVGGLILIAALTRVFAPFYPEMYFSHLAYAAVVWVAAVALWSSVFVIRMFRMGSEKEGC